MFLEKVFAEPLTINPPKTGDGKPFLQIVDLGTLISALVGVLLIVSALLAFLYLILGGMSWITSGGDKAAMESARNKITHAIVGLIIVGSSWAIMMLVQNFLGISIIGGTLQLPRPWN